MPIMINETQAKELLYRHREEEHTIFSIKFKKRGNDQIRDMVCRFKVKIHLQGGVQPYNPKEYNLITVFEMGVPFDPKTGKPPYKCIPFDGLMEIKLGGESYSIIRS